MIDAADVVAVDDACSYEAAEELGKEVDREASPRKLAKYALGEGDRGIQVGSGVAWAYISFVRTIALLPALRLPATYIPSMTPRPHPQLILW